MNLSTEVAKMKRYGQRNQIDKRSNAREKISQAFLALALILSLFTAFSCQKKTGLPQESSTPVNKIDRVKSPDGIDIEYQVQGKGEIALVFIHGWTCDRTYWKNQLPHFAKKYLVVALDLAGHGQSGLGRKNYTIESFAGDVKAVVDKLDLKKIVLIGHSMGGEISLVTVTLIPGKVIGIVGGDNFQDFSQRYEEELKQFITSLKSNYVQTVQSYMKSTFPASSPQALVEQIVNDMSSSPPEVGISAMENLAAFDPIPYLTELKNNLKIPIWCINSDMYPTNVEGNNKLTHFFAVKLMKGMSHFVQLEDPETFNRLLEEVLSSLLTGG
jgi:pimeloyl-ACP methyl ester carboxylesterase